MAGAADMEAVKNISYSGLWLFSVSCVLVNSKRRWLYLRPDNSWLEMALKGRNKLEGKQTT